MSIKKSVLSILLTPFHNTRFLENICLQRSEKQLNWKYLAVSISRQVSVSLLSGYDFVPATEFSSKCQCCSQFRRNSAWKTNGEGKHNSCFYSYQSLQNSEVKGWWHSDLDNEHDIFSYIIFSKCQNRGLQSQHINALRGDMVFHSLTSVLYQFDFTHLNRIAK